MTRVGPLGGVSSLPGPSQAAAVDSVDRERFEQALRVEPVGPGGGEDAAERLAQLLQERFGTPRNGLEQDRQALHDYLRHYMPLPKQRETALFDVLGKLGGEGTRYLNQLVNAELQYLIPRNALMVTPNAHPRNLDLEQ
ncbi:YopR/YscH family type III secretion effector [Pseudomonas entomophila]|uniref:YopR/YscH family type III secretion effector n=1 Tax=Pseudomonas entomophila TaxID=312306 RepID=UPI001F00B95C|nr:YopR/YscH family type III secretion effector [Pseudomonas entomophila]MCG8291432.1 hypothetical protein [Pseudomonas entomophila]